MVNIKCYTFYYKIRTLHFVSEIALFNSRTDTPVINLAITCPKATELDWQKLRKVIDDADTLLKIDCVRLDTLKDIDLMKEIENSKVIIFKRVVNNYSWYETFLDLGEALSRFSEILSMDNEDFPYTVETTIEIFEYSFELYWRLLKKIYADKGLKANSPNSAIQQAYSMQLIDDEQPWLEMLEGRNLFYKYKQTIANELEIYDSCEKYLKLMQKNYLAIQSKFYL